MSLRRILHHTATIYREQEHAEDPLVDGELVDGEADELEEAVGTFLCALFTPSGNERSRSAREVKEPTLMYLPGTTVLKSDELGIVAAEQNVAEGREADAEVRWQVLGTPQILGRPGRTPKAVIVTLRRVED